MQIRHLSSVIFCLVACSRHAAAPDEPWFNPPVGNTWRPDAAVISNMQLVLDRALRPRLEGMVNSTQPPVHYWFQYRAYDSGGKLFVAIIGRPFPVARHADMTFLGAFIPESCHVLATYVPDKDKIQDLAVGGFDCPPRI
jgi:hypothetical protein